MPNSTNSTRSGQTKKMAICNSCDDMRPEAWPRGAIAVRCMCLLPKIGTLDHYGRTMAVFNLGEVGAIQTPAWCPRNKKEETKDEKTEKGDHA